MKYFLRTFGCQANVSDSEKIVAWYENRGWKKAKTAGEADEVIINTCSVRQSAEHRVIGLVNNLKAPLRSSGQASSKIKSKPRVVLTGCMLYHGVSTLKKKLSGVNEFRPIKEFVSGNPKSQVPLRSSGKASSKFISIMEGCDNFCTYCVVPYARGREKSRPFDEIVCEAEEITKRGTEEIMLLGQNVNSFKPSFARLLKELNGIPGLKKISFMTSNPWDLSDEIIEALELPKIDRYLHLPVQSGDNEILRRMNRHYTGNDYLQLVGKIRKSIPDIKIGTDIIVGFPGETKEQFQNTVDLCKKAGFVKAYISRYSPRPGTAAAKFKDDVSPLEKKRRWQILEKLINEKLLS